MRIQPRPQLFLYFLLTSFAILFSMDELWRYLIADWTLEHSISDSMASIIVSILAFALLLTEDRYIRRKERQVAFLRHHINNALSVIRLACYRSLPREDMSRIEGAIDRVQRTLSHLETTTDVRIDLDKPERI